MRFGRLLKAVPPALPHSSQYVSFNACENNLTVLVLSFRSEIMIRGIYGGKLAGDVERFVSSGADKVGVE